MTDPQSLRHYTHRPNGGGVLDTRFYSEVDTFRVRTGAFMDDYVACCCICMF